MTARELATGQWFRWVGDWRVWKCVSDEVKTVEGQQCIHVLPLQPFPTGPSGYIPADSAVEIYPHRFIHLNSN